MKNPVWSRALKSCADPATAEHQLELLAATSAAGALKKASQEEARILCTLFSGAHALSRWLVANPEFVKLLTPDALKFPRRAQGFRRELETSLAPLQQAGDYAAAFGRLRWFRQREMLRIGTRDLAALSNVTELTRELSDLADVCLGAVCGLCLQQLTERFGRPHHRDPEGRWQPTEFAVLGLGKLGGQELNYSSDVDVLFVYSEEGHVFKPAPPRKSAAAPAGVMASHQFFNRLAELIIAEVSRMTAEGMLYRIDLRLRPEGESGPLARSLAGYENYYAQWGQTWERMMLIKARGVAGDAALAAEFVECIQPFRYPRSLGENVLSEVAAIKDRIETEVVKSGELDRNVKLGRGGIREIEFVVQALQLLHAGRQPFLQGAQTLPALDKLAQYHWLEPGDARALYEAYEFLRNLEHRLQMEEDQQTHTIPESAAARQRLAALMGFASLKAFTSALQAHTRAVRRVYDKLLRPDAAVPAFALPRDITESAAEWRRILAEHSFRNVEQSLRLLQEFVHGPGFGHVSTRTEDLALRLLPRLLAFCPKPNSRLEALNLQDRTTNAIASDAQEAFKVQGGAPPSPLPHAGRRRGKAGRGEAGRRRRGGGSTVSPLPTPFVPGRGNQRSAQGGKGVEMRPPLAPVLSDPDRVLTRLDSFIGAYGARATLFETWYANPLFFELLILLIDRSEFLAELAVRNPDLIDELVSSDRLRQRKSADEILADLRHGRDDADQRLWLRRYHQAELMRIGCRDILGLADFETNLAELSGLAEACLRYALESVCRKHRLKSPPLAIIGLGKLGGAELNYGSDLDLMFVAGESASALPRLQHLAVEVMEMLSSHTELGVAFLTDARLRPDGEKGLLVNTPAAYEEYYRRRAQLWEIQAISRARPIAGDPLLGQKFQQLTRVLTDFSASNVAVDFVSAGRAWTHSGLAAYKPDWPAQIHRMRLRIEKERTPSGRQDLAIKTGAGGLMDAEFLAQYFCLANGWQEPNTLRALERARHAGALGRPEADSLIENCRQLRRVEGILRRWSFEGETVLPDEEAPYYRVSIRCGFAGPHEFRAALSGWRKAIRIVYDQVLGGK